MNVVTPNGGDSVADRSWPGLLNPLLRGENLSSDETAWAMDRIMSGEATDAQIAGFAVALRAKGETVDEVTGLVRAMYAHANTIQVPGRTVDIVGTGGDLAKTVNISTMSAIVIAGTGAKVVKHGNRAASSASGSSDVLEKLGVNLELTPQRVVEVAEKAGITFCFAVKFHPALRYAAKAARNSARRPRSTSWAPSRTRPRSEPRRSASPTPGWRPSSRACWPTGATRPWSSAVTTASTS